MFRWAQCFRVAFFLVIGIRLLFFLAKPVGGNFARKFWYYVCFSLLFNYISFSGCTNSLLSLTPFADEKVEPAETSVPKEGQMLSMPDLDLWKSCGATDGGG